MGRPGSAYSLVLREELPYLLDLHLYLGRKAEAAPEAPDAAAVEAARAGMSHPDSGEAAAAAGGGWRRRGQRWRRGLSARAFR
jgi:ATP-dependent RNA helicase DDX54/DBP10